MSDASVATLHEPLARPTVTASAVLTHACHVSRLTSSDEGLWDQYVEKTPQATFFHTIAWRDSVRDAFGHEDIYLTARRGRQLVGILPMFLVASRLAGRMLVSVPYGVGGGIVADDEDAVSALFDVAKRIAEQCRCACIDLRSEAASVAKLATIDRYVGFQRELPATPGDVLDWLPRKARAAARNARHKYKLTVSFGDEHLPEVWRLYTMSMRRLASLNYPKRFFERLVELTPKHHWISVVRRDGRSVAGLVTFLFKDRDLYIFK